MTLHRTMYVSPPLPIRQFALSLNIVNNVAVLPRYFIQKVEKLISCIIGWTNYSFPLGETELREWETLNKI